MQSHYKKLFKGNPLPLFEYLEKIDPNFISDNFTNNNELIEKSFFVSNLDGFTGNSVEHILSFYRFCKKNGYDINKNINSSIDISEHELLTIINLPDLALVEIIKDVQNHFKLEKILKENKKISQMFSKGKLNTLDLMSHKSIDLTLELHEEVYLKNNFESYNYYISKIKKKDIINYFLEFFDSIKSCLNEQPQFDNLVDKTEAIFHKFSENDKQQLLRSAIDCKNNKYFNYLSKKMGLSNNEKIKFVTQNIDAVSHHSFINKILEKSNPYLFDLKDDKINIVHVVEKIKSLGYTIEAKLNYGNKTSSLINEGFKVRFQKIFPSIEEAIKTKDSEGQPFYKHILTTSRGIHKFGDGLDYQLLKYSFNYPISNHLKENLEKKSYIQDILQNTFFLKDSDGSYLYEQKINNLDGFFKKIIKNFPLSSLSFLLTEEQKYSIFNSLIKDLNIHNVSIYDLKQHNSEHLDGLNFFKLNNIIILDYLFKEAKNDKDFKWHKISISPLENTKLVDSEIYFTIKAYQLEYDLNSKLHNKDETTKKQFKV